MEAALQELLDREAVRDVLRRYAHAVDRRDIETIASLFTEDAAYRGSLGEGNFRTALEQLRERMSRYRSTMHLLGNQLIQVSGDTASAETYAVAYHRPREDDRSLLSVGVRYCDDLVRQQGAWKIRRRVVHLEWQKYDDTLLPEVASSDL